jgi:multiple sugar transport system permease protein
MNTGTAAPSRRSRRPRHSKVLVYALLCVGGATMMLPLLWMLSTSLKDPGNVFTSPPQFIPRRQVTWRDAASGEDLPVFTMRVAGETRRAAVVRRSPEGVIVRPLDASGQAGEETTVPADSLRPVYEVHFRWRNYLDAAQALTLDRNWLSFAVPAYRVSLRHSTWEFGPWSFPGFPLRNAFIAFYLNSIIVTTCVTLGEVVTSSLAAFAFARLRFPGRDALFVGYLGTMMVPSVVTMIPVFVLLKQLHLIDTYAALILPVMFSAYGTFMLRQFFLTIPAELEDAAKIDGCGRFGVYRHVILPLSKPALATLTTFTFLGTWNAFMWPLIVINSMQRKPLMVGLYAFVGQYSTDWTMLMAASVMVMVPVLIVFILGQRYFVQGIVMSGLKG